MPPPSSHHSLRALILAGYALLLLAATGCGDSGIFTESDTTPLFADDGTRVDGSSWVFDQEKVRSYHLYFPDAGWAQTLQHNAIYVGPNDKGVDEIKEYDSKTDLTALLQVDGFDARIGVRYKGARGTLTSCFGIDGLGEPQQLCDKLSLRFNFRHNDPELRFYGLNRLNLHSMIHDAAMLRDSLAYHTLREMGIPAPRTAHVKLYINGHYMGLYVAVEFIDGRFTGSRFAKGGDGNLYKDVWPQWDNPLHFSNALDNNKDSADVSEMVTLSTVIANSVGLDAANWRATLSPHIDLEGVARYMTTIDAIRQWDSPLAWSKPNPEEKLLYGDEVSQRAEPHNVYWYRDTDTAQRFSIIPWDMDGALVPFSRIDTMPLWYDPNTLNVPQPISDYDPTVDDPCLTKTVYRAVPVIHPGCDPLIRGVADFLPEARQQALQQLLTGPLSEGEMAQSISHWQQLIAQAVFDEMRRPEAEWSSAEWGEKMATAWNEWAKWQRYTDDLIQIGALLRERLTSQLNGTPVPLAFVLDPTANNDFEQVSQGQIKAGISRYGSLGGESSVSLNRNTPLQGNRSLHFDFTWVPVSIPAGVTVDHDISVLPIYRWMHIAIPFRQLNPTDFNIVGQADLSGLTTLHLVLRGDQAQALRIEINSRNYSRNNGAALGWNIQLGAGETRCLALPVSEMVWPSWDTEEPKPASDTPANILLSSSSLMFKPLAPEDINISATNRTAAQGQLIIDDIFFAKGGDTPPPCPLP